MPGEPGESDELHEYAGMMYSHSVTMFRPVSILVELPPASGPARR